MSHFRNLKRMYEAAPCNESLRPLIKVQKAAAEVQMDVTPNLFHSAGAVHGSYYFKLLDDAAFFAANSLEEDVFVITVSFNVQLLQPIMGGKLRAVGRVTRPTKTLIFADSKLYDTAGDELARGSGVFARSKIDLREAVGYSGP